MASERFANTLPFSGVKDGHEAVVVALHTLMIEAGFKCTGIGEEIPNTVSNCATDALPQGWNVSPDVYTLQYKQSTSFQKVFLLKALRLGTRLAVHVLDVDKESCVDLTIKTLDYVTEDNNKLLHHLYDYPRVVNLPNLEKLFNSDIINKIIKSKEESSSRSRSLAEPHSHSILWTAIVKVIEDGRDIHTWPTVIPRTNDDDPLRVPLRHPSNSRPWNPSVHDPFAFGDPDRLPGHPGSGGMLMDPFHQRHRGPENDFGHPGLPRGAVPPGARFDPFGPASPDGGMGGNPRSGRFSGPGPDHLRPPGFDDDMFM